MRFVTITTGMLLLSGLIYVSCSFSEMDMMPARPEGPHFDHAAHLLRHARECKNCHGEADVEWKGMPELKTCMGCHDKLDKDKPEERFASAFFDENKKGRWTAITALDEEKLFNHAKHVEKVEDCLRCHLRVAQSTSIPVGAALSMEACEDCHEKEAPEKMDCVACHKDNRKDVRPASHHPGWSRDHGRQAWAGVFNELPKDCARCHTRSTCDTCHLAEPPRSHTNLWRRYGHGPMAYLDRDRCFVCHRDDSCSACHLSSKPRNHRGGGWGFPFQQHCNGCHLPLEQFGGEECAECHKWNPSHTTARPRPSNPAHMLGPMPEPSECLACHNSPLTMPHAHNGQSCLFCHQ